MASSGSPSALRAWAREGSSERSRMRMGPTARALAGSGSGPTTERSSCGNDDPIVQAQRGLEQLRAGGLLALLPEDEDVLLPPAQRGDELLEAARGVGVHHEHVRIERGQRVPRHASAPA